MNFDLHLIRKTLEDQFELKIFDKSRFKAMVIENFGLSTKTIVNLVMTVKRANKKTNKQLGYLHTEVLNCLLIAYKHLGWYIKTTEQAKNLFKEQNGFAEKFVNTETGEMFTANYKSFADLDISEMCFVIQTMIDICNEAGIEVKPPREKIEGLDLEFKKQEK